MTEETSNKEIPAIDKDQTLKVTDAKENVIKESIPTAAEVKAEVKAEEKAEEKNSEKENQHRDKTRKMPPNFEKYGKYFHSNPMKEKQICEDNNHQFHGVFGRDRNCGCHPYYFRNGVNTVPDHSDSLCHQKCSSKDNECKDCKPENLDKGKHEEVHADSSSQMGHFKNPCFSDHSEHFEGRNHFRRPHYSDIPPFFNGSGHHGVPGGGNYFNVPCFYGGPNHYVGPECYERPNHFEGPCIYGGRDPFSSPGQFSRPGHFGTRGHFGSTPCYYGGPDHFMNSWQFNRPGHFGTPDPSGTPCYYGGPDHFVDPRYFQGPNYQQDTCHSDENDFFQMPRQTEDSSYSPKFWNFYGSRHFGRPENFGHHGPFHRKFPSPEESQPVKTDFPWNSRHDKHQHINSSRHFARRNYIYSKLTTPIEDRPIFREFDFC